MDNPEPGGIEVNIEKDFTGVDFDQQQFESLVRFVCGQFDVDRASVNIIVVDDSKIIETNKDFLDRDSVTDVISFDLSEADCPVRFFDIVVNGQMAQRQAQKRGHESTAELALYIVHGLLHNLGFDDMVEADAVKMHQMEDELLVKSGFGKVYKKQN